MTENQITIPNESVTFISDTAIHEDTISFTKWDGTRFSVSYSSINTNEAHNQLNINDQNQM